MHFSGPECCWTDFLEMSKRTVRLLCTRSCNSVARTWKLYVATPADARGVLKQLSTMYLEFIESGLKMLLGSVAGVFTF